MHPIFKFCALIFGINTKDTKFGTDKDTKFFRDVLCELSVNNFVPFVVNLNSSVEVLAAVVRPKQRLSRRRLYLPRSLGCDEQFEIMQRCLAV